MNAAPVPIRLNVYFDPQVRRFWADSPDLDGLTIEADTREELRREAFSAAETLLDLAGVAGTPELTLHDAVHLPE